MRDSGTLFIAPQHLCPEQLLRVGPCSKHWEFREGRTNCPWWCSSLGKTVNNQVFLKILRLLQIIPRNKDYFYFSIFLQETQNSQLKGKRYSSTHPNQNCSFSYPKGTYIFCTKYILAQEQNVSPTVGIL